VLRQHQISFIFYLPKLLIFNQISRRKPAFPSHS
jgi:hypothetical protein